MKITKFLLPLIFPVLVSAIVVVAIVGVGALAITNYQREVRTAETFIAVRNQQIQENKELIKKIGQDLDKTTRMRELENKFLSNC